MEANNTKLLETKSNISLSQSNNPTIELTKDQILDYIESVTTGCCDSIYVPNTLSSWKITARGLRTIKHIEKDFYLGVKMWLNITQNNILDCNDDVILELMSNQFIWIQDLLLIKKYINTSPSN